MKGKKNKKNNEEFEPIILTPNSQNTTATLTNNNSAKTDSASPTPILPKKGSHNKSGSKQN